MDQKTVNELLEINRRFYEMSAEEFSNTRISAWLGWERLVPLLPQKQSLSVLDVGCGNGRFGEFLQEQSIAHTYTGVDGSAALLRIAQEKVPLGTFIHADVMADLGTTRYDVVVAFGVLHHIPSTELRSQLLTTMARLVLPDGILAISLWEFTKNERLMKRAVPLPEQGDFLLPWRKQIKARYCHSFEHDTITLPLTLIDDYEADLSNRYLVWRGV